ncbi:MAG: histone acetyltransferase [Rhodoglobus sp.]|nr:histone acetyltransferase [Rhodoglobus sp.]
MTEIRDIREGDQHEWRRLFLEYGVFYKTDFSDAVLDGVWAWLMDAESDVCAVVAADGGRAFGFAHYRRLPDTFTAGPAWFLDDLYVEPGHRGAGTGAALIDAVAERAASDGGGTLRWITAADNETAQSVYNRVATKTSWVTYERET